jgi:hypothetical protein
MWQVLGSRCPPQKTVALPPQNGHGLTCPRIRSSTRLTSGGVRDRKSASIWWTLATFSFASFVLMVRYAFLAKCGGRRSWGWRLREEAKASRERWARSGEEQEGRFGVWRMRGPSAYSTATTKLVFNRLTQIGRKPALGVGYKYARPRKVSARGDGGVLVMVWMVAGGGLMVEWRQKRGVWATAGVDSIAGRSPSAILVALRVRFGRFRGAGGIEGGGCRRKPILARRDAYWSELGGIVSERRKNTPRNPAKRLSAAWRSNVAGKT